MTPRPPWLTVICCVLMALGLLAVVSPMLTLASQVYTSAMQDFMAEGMAELPSDTVRPMMDHQAKLLEVQRKWRPWSLGVGFAAAFVGGGAIIGAIQTLRNLRQGRWTLRASLVAFLLLELLRIYPSVGIQLATQKLQQEFMQELMASAEADAPPQFDSFVESFSRSISFVGLAVTVMWILIKLGFLGHSIYYTRKKKVEEYYRSLPA